MTLYYCSLLCSVVDNVEVLIDEWFPGLRNVSITAGDSLVCPYALCPLCPGINTCICTCYVIHFLTRVYLIQNVYTSTCLCTCNM